jgi:hypothetical protein
VPAGEGEDSYLYLRQTAPYFVGYIYDLMDRTKMPRYGPLYRLTVPSGSVERTRSATPERASEPAIGLSLGSASTARLQRYGRRPLPQEK